MANHADKKITSILIANRGEIACRIIRTCKKLGIKACAIYSEADKHAQHVKHADQSYALGGFEAKDSYLDIDKVLAAAQTLKVDAIHPGYGFLSENAEFAEKVEKSGIIFIGPKAKAIRQIGDKTLAKALAQKIGVPTVPGILIDDRATAKKAISDFVKKVNYPILIKAAAGGGGRGMRKVYQESELESALASAAREALSFFKDERLFVEKLVEKARHIEVQIFGDRDGQVIHLYDRDCSYQRKHQKVIEEAPAPNIPEQIRNAILRDAVKICAAANYQNAGTVEFLYATDGRHYFLEVNSRLQVEHPVTEIVTGLDLVELQIKVAQGDSLAGLTPKICGAAIECRLCAEDPNNNFTPATGILEVFKMPTEMLGLRIDSGFSANDQVSHYYDSMLAKVIGYGSDRQQALTNSQNAISQIQICGVKTNLEYLKILLDRPEFLKVEHHIQIAENFIPDAQQTNLTALKIAAFHLIAKSWSSQKNQNFNSWNSFDFWRAYPSKLSPSIKTDYNVAGINCQLGFEVAENGLYNIYDQAQDSKLVYKLSQLKLISENKFSLSINQRTGTQKTEHFELYIGKDSDWICTEHGSYSVKEKLRSLRKDLQTSAEANKNISSPLPGKIIDLKVKVGQEVAAGQTLLVIESMKMEHLITAPSAAKIAEVLIEQNQVVEANKLLVKLV